jgi:Fe-S cluster assembly ATPase SufC
MRVITVRDFRDRASEMFRSEDVILVTREGRPAGFFLPWQGPELPEDVRREIFLRLTEQIAAQRDAREVTEEEVLTDFAASRRRR